ncbi:MAG: RT0821/Lpp0805 family surface protein [Pseudorhizobium sp.]
MVLVAKSNTRSKGAMRKVACSFVLGLAALSTTSCTSSLDLLGSASKPDRSISTGSVSGGRSETTLSDEATVRNAVSSADLAKVGDAPLPWANAATGSAGVVSTIREARREDHVCRDFTTTRHSYEGIAMFSGRACLTGSGDWLLTAFDRQ